jgi:hypothetical protein
MPYMEKNREKPAQPNGETIGEVLDAGGEPVGSTSEGSGWTTTKTAAKALGVSRRMVQEYVRRGDLAAVVDGKGVSKTYYVSIDSLNALRDRRKPEVKDAQNFANVSRENESSAKSQEVVGETMGDTLRQIVERLEARTAEAADLRVRLELTDQAESTLREALERERLRADQERGRADRLEAELREIREQPPEQQDVPESIVVSSEVEQDAGQMGGDQEGQKEARKRRSWLHRFFFGP